MLGSSVWFSRLRLPGNIIDSGKIPLVHSTIDADDNIRIELHPGDFQSRYTAFSHVWAGGLGNFHQNSLPTCQLRELHHDVANLPCRRAGGGDDMDLLYQDSYYQWVNALPSKLRIQGTQKRSQVYWIDSLCIPVDSTSPHTPYVPSMSNCSSGHEYQDNDYTSEVQTHSKSHSSVVPRYSPEFSYDNTEPASASSSEYRLKAINSMSRIYAGAANIIAIDPELLYEDPSRSSSFEMSMALQICPWMARSWTLQEGALATNVYLRFAPGMRQFFGFHETRSMLGEYLVEDIWRQDVLNETHPTLSLSLGEFAAQELGRIVIAGFVPSNRDHEISFTEHQNYRFCRVWNELAKRTTTKQDDVAAILAA